MFFGFYVVAEALDLVIEGSDEKDTISSYDIVLHPPDNGQNSEQESGAGHIALAQLNAPAEPNRIDSFADSNGLHQSLNK